MLRYRLLCIGRRARDPLLDAVDAYARRLGRYAKLDIIRLKESDREREGKVLAAKLEPQERLVALDERGETLTTRELAKRVESWQRLPQPRVALLIGGADGLAPALLDRADERLALSHLTLPHRLALVLICEQLYRAHTILRGEPYHRD